jgi:hypothetical protein
MFQFILLVTLLVGSLLYFSQLGFKKVGIYWLVFIGSAFLVVLLPGYVVLVIQMITVGVFYSHAKLASVC